MRGLLVIWLLGADRRHCAGESDSEEQAISSDSEEQKRWRPQVSIWIVLQYLYLQHGATTQLTSSQEQALMNGSRL